MKTTNRLGYEAVVADIPNKGYCKILLNNSGVITKAYVGSSEESSNQVYSSTIPDSCWKDSMLEMLTLSPTCFIELFNSLKSTEQLAYAKEIAQNQLSTLVYDAQEILKTAIELKALIAES